MTVGVSPYDPGPGHHHLPRTLARNSLNSNTTDSGSRNRGPRGADRGGRARRRRQAVARPSRARPIARAGARTRSTCDTTPVPFASLGLDPRLLEGIRDLGFKETRPDPERGHPARARRPRPDRLRRNRHRQDRRVRRADAAALLHDHAKDVAAGSRTAGCRARAACWCSRRRASWRCRSKTRSTASPTTPPITSAAVYGGVEMGPQERALKAGVDIIVATPGPADGSHAAAERRLQRHRAARARRSRSHDGHGLLARRPPHHRRAADRCARRCSSRRRCRTRWCSDALEIARDAEVRAGRPAQRAGQEHHAPRRSRSRRTTSSNWLIGHLQQPAGPVLVFSRTKIGADRLARRLAAAGIKCTALHADRSQDQRRIAVEGFRERQLQSARRHRHRRARPRHRRHPHGHQLRSARLTRTLRAPRGPHRPR